MNNLVKNLVEKHAQNLRDQTKDLELDTLMEVMANLDNVKEVALNIKGNIEEIIRNGNIGSYNLNPDELVSLGKQLESVEADLVSLEEVISSVEGVIQVKVKETIPELLSRLQERLDQEFKPLIETLVTEGGRIHGKAVPLSGGEKGTPQYFAELLSLLSDADLFAMNHLNPFPIQEYKEALEELQMFEKGFGKYLEVEDLDRLRNLYKEYRAKRKDYHGGKQKYIRVFNFIKRSTDSEPIFRKHPEYINAYGAIREHFQRLEARIAEQAMLQPLDEDLLEYVESELGQIKDLRSVIEEQERDVPDLPWDQLELKLVKFEERLTELQEREVILKKLVNQERFHRDCSTERVDRVLENKPEGTYLLRPGATPDTLIMSYRVQGDDGLETKSTQEMRIGSKNELKLRDGRELSVEELARELSNAEPDPLEHVPMDHLTAQFEWNLTNELPEVTLEGAQSGTVCVTQGSEEGKYVLHILEKSASVGADAEIRSVEVKVENGVILGSDPEIEIKAESFHQFLTTGLGMERYVLVKQPPQSTFEALYYQELLPSMQANGEEWVKISRGEYPWLPHSVIASQKGEMYEQIHASLRIQGRGKVKREGAAQGKDKGARGQGGIKSVWDLKPFYSTQPAFVRARIRRLDHKMLRANMELIRKMKREIPEDIRDLFLFPSTFSYRKKNGRVVYAQVMPSMQGDLFDLIDDISLKGKVGAFLQVGRGLVAMHERGFVHLDIKLENLMVESLDTTDDPSVRVADFDLALEPEEDEDIARGTPEYLDPKMYLGEVKGMKGAKVADQFSFGATLYGMLMETHYQEIMMK